MLSLYIYVIIFNKERDTKNLCCTIDHQLSVYYMLCAVQQNVIYILGLVKWSKLHTILHLIFKNVGK